MPSSFLILLRSSPPLLGCRPLLLSLFSLSHPHGLPLPCTLLGLPPRVVVFLPTSLLVVTVLRGGAMSYLSWGFPYPPPPPFSSLLSVGCLSTTSVYLPPLAPSSFPHSPLTLFRLSSPVPAPSLSLSQAPTSGRLLPHMSSPCSEVGCRWSFGFWGCPLYPPFTIRDCCISQFCAAIPVASGCRITLHPSLCLGYLFRLLYVI